MPVPFAGVGVALITLFDEHGAVLVEATAEHAARLAELGMRFVLVCGSTGEAAWLSSDERVALVGAVRGAVPSSVAVLAGTGAATADAAARLTAEAQEAGADGMLALSPPGSSGLAHYYTAVVAGAGGLPVLAYHFPTMSAPGIPVEALPELPVAGLKDSSGDPDRLIAELSSWDGSVFVGSTRTLELARSLGAAGAILGIANAEPEICVAAFDGDASAQRALAAAKDREVARGFPHGIKHLTGARFGVSAIVRRDTISSSQP
jgi:4-hydroxy-tetrahydrodipicolinate synthase